MKMLARSGSAAADDAQSRQASQGDELQRRGGAANRSSSSSPRPGGYKRIAKCDKFKDIYKMGAEVMPSTHSYIRVVFGKRIADGLECVVKIRLKPTCFRTKEDEGSWRHRTECLLNIPLPDNAGICKIYEVTEDSEGYYIVMERVMGVDLFEALEGDSLHVDPSREVLRHLLISIRHLHMYNMVHRDLKLENVMVNPAMKGMGKLGKKVDFPTGGSFPDSLVKIIDFDTLDEWTPKRPNSKDVVGTDQYIAQEAYAGKYSQLSDIFSVGVIAYKIFTGKFPFSDDIFEECKGANWAGSPQMTVIRRRLKVSIIDFHSYSVFRENPMIVDLVSKMLSYNEIGRPTATVALQHPFFREAGTVTVAKPRPALPRIWNEDLVDDGVIIAESS